MLVFILTLRGASGWTVYWWLRPWSILTSSYHFISISTVLLMFILTTASPRRNLLAFPRSLSHGLDQTLRKRTSSCPVQRTEQSKCTKLTIDNNIQLTLYKALHYSEGPYKIAKIFQITVLKHLFWFAQWMECDQNWFWLRMDKCEWNNHVSGLWLVSVNRFFVF